MLRPSPRHSCFPRFLAVAAWLALSAFALSACSGSKITAPKSPPQAEVPPPPAPGEATAPPVNVAPPEPPAAPSATARKVRVALLLPLSGQNGALGHAMLDAAQMALFDVADEKLELMPRDTRGTPEGAAEAAREVLSQKAQLIIGPLLAGEVQAVKPLARSANVPVLAFSTATQLAGDGTYLLSFLPRQEIQRVASFAHAHGVNRFAALAPRTAYGEIAVQALRDAAQAEGAQVTTVEFYDPNTPDLSAVVKRFATASRDMDAVLLPEGGARLRALAPILPYYDLDPEKLHFLGTGLWDEPGLATEPALVGGWYAAPSPAARAEFEKRFQELYKHTPPRLASLGYDATALAAALAHGEHGADFSAAAITNPSGFAGVDGIFRLRPDGLVQRGLAVLEIHRDGNTVVQTAPETFQALGL